MGAGGGGGEHQSHLDDQACSHSPCVVHHLSGSEMII